MRSGDCWSLSTCAIPGPATGLQATWPAVLGPLGLPLDHILTSPELVATRRGVSAGIGSDHRPVFAELRFRR